MKKDGALINEKFDALLSSFAQKNATSLGRLHAENPDPHRTPFQRDRDRVIHASAFRRLRGKTQVVSPQKGDHFRNRLTHTLEVSQIARDIARQLGLNEDLAETIALAHDLGHPPFGHAGETALHECLFAATGDSFEHNQQSLRIINVFEPRYADFEGLNLTWEVREGLKKHDTKFIHPVTGKRIYSPSLESQVVDVSDEIAYLSADLEDALRGGFINIQDLNQIEICRQVLAKIPASELSFRPSLIRGVMRLLISALVENIQQNLATNHIQTFDDVQNFQGGRLAVFDRSMYKKFRALKQFLMKHYYRAPKVMDVTNRGQKIIKSLFVLLEQTPTLMQNFDPQKDKYQQIVDFIAGMTDNFAEDFYKNHIS
ncbi:deoxyguanosinetriphosphate triphosphohydrolase [bacterium DOLZORAL124_38_8]|nr:MAG: deoxyguanosinetriphosphate triphosphohydrolase [bacterium DOLZORAL124_38_8]